MFKDPLWSQSGKPLLCGKRFSLIAIGLILLSATAVGGFFVEMHHHFHPPAPPEQDPPAATALDAQRQNSRYFRQLIALDRSFASKDRAEANRRLDALDAFLPKLIPAYNDRLQFFSEGGMACPGGPASMPCSIGP